MKRRQLHTWRDKRPHSGAQKECRSQLCNLALGVAPPGRAHSRGASDDAHCGGEEWMTCREPVRARSGLGERYGQEMQRAHERARGRELAWTVSCQGKMQVGRDEWRKRRNASCPGNGGQRFRGDVVAKLIAWTRCFVVSAPNSGAHLPAKIVPRGPEGRGLALGAGTAKERSAVLG
ncbi:hypothetical protein TRVL_06277 [Trypanosoma vivax]|nr:hypothetical protein TRVL_06277 [Trypanosoma vivax]